MKECIRIKQIYPVLVSGFDFVGQEDLGRPLAPSYSGSGNDV